MSKAFLLALAGVVALGVGATVIVYLGTAAPRRPNAFAAAVAPVEPAVRPAPIAPPVLPPAPAQPAALPPSPPPVSEPVRAAPVNAPEYQERLESDDPEERSGAEVEIRDQRRGQMMNWLNRPRRR